MSKTKFLGIPAGGKRAGWMEMEGGGTGGGGGEPDVVFYYDGGTVRLDKGDYNAVVEKFDNGKYVDALLKYDEYDEGARRLTQIHCKPISINRTAVFDNILFTFTPNSDVLPKVTIHLNHNGTVGKVS